MASTSALASTEFRWASGFSENPNLDAAVAEACAAVRTGLGGASPDIAVIFVSGALEGQYERAAPAIMEALKPRVLVGTTGMGVIGVGREVEERAAVSISAGRLPGIHIAPFRLLAQKLEELDVSPANWSHFLGCPKEGPVHFLLFAHPHSTPVDDLVGALDALNKTDHAQQWGAFNLYANVMLLDAEFVSGAQDGNTPQYAPDFLVRAGGIYRWRDRVKVALLGTFLDDHFADDGNTDSFFIPGYMTWDLTLEARVWKGLSVIAGVNNLFDEDYYARIRGDGIDPAYGRHYYGGLSFVF